MKPKIELSVDKSKVTEGEIVEITWSCPLSAQSVYLTLDNGYKKNSVPVELSGNKKFRLNRSKGRTHLVIEAMIDGKKVYNSVTVRVKKMKTMKADEVYDYTGAKGVRKNGLRNTWENYKAKVKTMWKYMPDNKRLALKILLGLNLVMLLTAIWPKFLIFGFLLLIGYLCWIIMKR